MAPYFVLLALVAGLAFVSLLAFRLQAHVTSSVLVCLFVGLGYEVGFDWLAYHFNFWWTPTTAEEFSIRTLVPVEPLYFALNLIVKLAGGDFQTLLVVCAVINVASIHYVTGRISRSQAAVWTIYIGIALLIGPFNVLRQTLASSFILLSLSWWTESRKLPTVAAFAAALGFHISAVMFVVLFPLKKVWPNTRAVVAFICVGVAIAAARIDTFTLAVNGIAAVAPGWIGDKLQNYQWSDEFSISTGALLLIGLHLAFLGVVYKFATEEERKDPKIILAIWLTIFVLGCHLYLSAVPSFWNRVILVALPWQAATLFRLERIRISSVQVRSVVVCCLAVISAGSLWYGLRAPGAAPFAYRSVIEQAFFDDNGGKRGVLLDTTRCFHTPEKLEYTLYALGKLEEKVLRPDPSLCSDDVTPWVAPPRYSP